RLAVSLLPAATGGFAAMLVTTVTALPVAAFLDREVRGKNQDGDSGEADGGNSGEELPEREARGEDDGEDPGVASRRVKPLMRRVGEVGHGGVRRNGVGE